MNSGESLPFFSKSNLQSLPKSSSPFFGSNLEFPSKDSSSLSDLNFHLIPHSSFTSSLDSDADISSHDHIYISFVDLWIEEYCNQAYDPWHHITLIIHDLYPSSFPKSRIVEIPPRSCLILDISLFSYLMKHKGRHHGISNLTRWLH